LPSLFGGVTQVKEKFWSDVMKTVKRFHIQVECWTRPQGNLRLGQFSLASFKIASETRWIDSLQWQPQVVSLFFVSSGTSTPILCAVSLANFCNNDPHKSFF
jgi:hypothetical protein